MSREGAIIDGSSVATDFAGKTAVGSPQELGDGPKRPSAIKKQSQSLTVFMAEVCVGSRHGPPILAAKLLTSGGALAY